MRFGTFHLAEAPEVHSPGEAIAAELRQIVMVRRSMKRFAADVAPAFTGLAAVARTGSAS